MTHANDEPEDPRTPFREWPTAGRWAVYVAVGLVLVLLLAGLSGVLLVRRSFPQVAGTVHLEGLTGEVDVRRDQHGIPQIYADSSQDLFYAQGFVQAQDRFWQMDFRRHLAAGRLSELLGAAAVEADLMVRTMGWRRTAERELSLLAPETRSYLEAFSHGVNAYLDSRGTTRLSLEYVVLGLGGLDYQPEHWTPVDSLAWLKSMAWTLRSNVQDEIDRARLSIDRSPAQIDELYPGYPYAEHTPITRFVGAPAPSRRGGAGAGRLGSSQGLGSNSWVVSGAHTTTGLPMLANDPHLAPSIPGAWYQTGLHCRTLGPSCPFDVSGFTFAGVPGVIIGHNERVAWGLSSLAADVTDLFLEKVRGHSYLSAGRWRPLAEHDEIIRIHGAPARTVTVRSTPHGPLLSDVSRELSSVGANARVPAGSPDRGNGYAVALAWTALAPDRTADAIFAVDRATDWPTFREAARGLAAPTQSLVYADREGNIGYQASGKVPIRKGGRTGGEAVPGWLPRNDWTGRYLPFDALPHELNPPDGIVVAADQAVTGPDYGHRLGDAWDAGFRSQRIRGLVEQRLRTGKVGVDDLTRIQLDARNPIAPVLVPYLMKVLLPSQYEADGQRILAGWDFQETSGSAGAAYFNAVWRNLLRLTFHDQLRRSLWPDGGDRWMVIVERLLRDPSSSWWDDANTSSVVENRDIILAEAMRAARDDLTREVAADPAHWSWGALHQLPLRNRSLGQSHVGLVRALFNRGPFPLAGGSALVNATAWDAAEGYDATSVPSMRMVVDLAHPDASTWINLTGASGHAFNDNYTDQTALWRQGRYLSWPFSAGAVGKATKHTLRLVPTG